MGERRAQIVCDAVARTLDFVHQTLHFGEHVIHEMRKHIHFVAPADRQALRVDLRARRTVGAEIAAGVPVLSTVGARDGAMLLALKSGNFGGPEFFSGALRLMR